MKSRPVVAALLALASMSACVDAFEGIDIQLTLDEGVLGAAAPSDTPSPGQPPANTFLSLYAIDETKQTESRSYAHELIRFEIVPVVNPGSPCFIEVENLERRNYAGLHVMQLVRKLKSETGIDDPLDPPAGTDQGDVIDILTAERRLSFVPQLASQLRAVVAPSIEQTPEVDVGCVGDGGDTSPDLIPPRDCIDDESNERRLVLCEGFWERHPDQYEGSDRAYTAPLNGTFYGLVDGVNPRNSAPLGGVEFLIEVRWGAFEQLAVNWQYEDADSDGQPDYPEDLPESQRSVLGFHVLEGRALEIKRGVISYPLRNRTFSSISGEATVLDDLGGDDVHF